MYGSRGLLLALLSRSEFQSTLFFSSYQGRGRDIHLFLKIKAKVFWGGIAVGVSKNETLKVCYILYRVALFLF